MKKLSKTKAEFKKGLFIKKACILLKVLHLNSSSLSRQLTFLALFSRYNPTSSIVSSVLTVLLLPYLPLLMFRVVPSPSDFFAFVLIVLFVGGSFSGNLSQKAFYFQIATGFAILLTAKARCSVVNRIFNIEAFSLK